MANPTTAEFSWFKSFKLLKRGLSLLKLFFSFDCVKSKYFTKHDSYILVTATNFKSVFINEDH